MHNGVGLVGWLGRLVLAVLIPLLLLLAVEVGLRWTGWGVDPSFVVSFSSDAGNVWHENPDIGRLWFPAGQARSPVSFSLGDKKTNEMRVVVVGESAAMGDPVPDFGFPVQLETILRHRYPEAEVQVINAAMTAIDSTVILQIAASLHSLKPDVALVYMGNNEIVGPFGPTPGQRSTQTLSARFSRFTLMLRSLRVGQFLGNALERWFGPEPATWRGLAQFTDRVLSSNSEILAAVHKRYADNLSLLVQKLEKADVVPVVCTVASRPFWPPFGPEASPDGRAAIDAYRQSLSSQTIDGVGDVSKSLVSRDLDPLRFRADAKMNDAVRALSNRIEVVDVERMFMGSEAASGALFWDHVHFTPEGNYRVASMLDLAIEPELRRQGWIPARVTPSREDVLKSLLYTSWDELNTVSIMHQRLLRPPFTFMTDHTNIVAEITGRLRELLITVNRQTVEEVRDQLLAANAASPDNDFILARLARIHEELDELDEALTAAQILVEKWPHVRSYHHTLGRHLMRVGRYDEGIRHLERGEIPGTVRPFMMARIEGASIMADNGDVQGGIRMLDQAIRTDQSFAKAWYNRAIMFGRLGQLDASRRDFQQALMCEPDMPEAFNNLGIISLKLNDTADAERHFRQAIEHHPYHVSALRNLAYVLSLRGASAEEKTIRETLALCDPDWKQNESKRN